MTNANETTTSEQATTVPCAECGAAIGERCSVLLTVIEGSATSRERCDRMWPHGGRVLHARALARRGVTYEQSEAYRLRMAVYEDAGRYSV